MNNLPALCNDVFPKFLIFSSNVSSLVYYSHLSVVFISLILGLFILLNDPKKLINRVFFFTIFSFIIWVLLDSVFWAANRGDIIMFVWSMTILFEPLVYIGGFYLIHLLAYKRDMTFLTKVVIGLMYLPVIIFVPTSYTLTGFDITTCLSTEGLFGYYDYIIELIFAFWLLVIAVQKYKASTDVNFRKQLLYITVGVSLFLFSFSWGNIVSSFTDNWQISQIGLFAMPVFIGFLVYSIIRFKTFNIKLIGTQALVVALIVLIASQFIFIQIPINRLLNGIALLLIIIFGFFLIKSVKKEIIQREHIQDLLGKISLSNTQLEKANGKLKELDKLKTEFLSLASHQLRSPLTAIKGYSSMLLEGDFGKVEDKAREAIDKIFQSSQNLTKVVDDLLNVSKIEQGGMKYEMATFSLSTLARDTVAELAINAEKKGLKMNFTSDSISTVKADKEKIRQVMLNLIDNSIKYTKVGEINISVHNEGSVSIFQVKDTGMGMTKEIKDSLFQKFSRGEGARMDTSGSGLGLYLAKEIIEAHEGKIYVDSEGTGKGSVFTFELKHYNSD